MLIIFHYSGKIILSFRRIELELKLTAKIILNLGVTSLPDNKLSSISNCSTTNYTKVTKMSFINCFEQGSQFFQSELSNNIYEIVVYNQVIARSTRNA